MDLPAHMNIILILKHRKYVRFKLIIAKYNVPVRGFFVVVVCFNPNTINTDIHLHHLDCFIK